MELLSKLGMARLACALTLGLGLAVTACSDDDDGGTPAATDSGAPPSTSDSGVDAATPDSGPATGTDSAVPLPEGITEAECIQAAMDMGTTIGDAERMQCEEGVTAALCAESASCICDSCICLLGACEQSAACMGLRACAQATGCTDMACFLTNALNPACTGLLGWAADTNAIATVRGLGDCVTNAGCGDIECAGDGGTGDGG